MTTKTKLIRTIYLYAVALVSLIFTGIGAGTILNTGLKYYLFPEAEKKSYFDCNYEPPMAAYPSKEGTTPEQKEQIDAMIKDYKKWKEEITGDNCIRPARQNKIIDALTMLIIALPICLFHWRIIKKDKKDKEENN